MTTMGPPLAFPASLAPHARHRVIGGNPPHAPHRYGWVLRLGRWTTDDERVWLKSAGFEFSGGKWTRADEGEHCRACGEAGVTLTASGHCSTCAPTEDEDREKPGDGREIEAEMARGVFRP